MTISSDPIQPILTRVVDALRGLPGVQAIVLGGSRSRGTHLPGSDIDIGIYYRDAESLDLAAINVAAQILDDEHRENLVTPPGGWGPWVNAGGWLVVDGIHTDLILRDTGRVRQAIEDCQTGKVSSNYQPGHPHAFQNAIYMGELAVCKLLWTGSDVIPELKMIADIYPARLKEGLITYYSFEAGFSSMLAAGNAQKDDIYYVSAHIVRSISCLNQWIFALNEQYCLNEKNAVRMIDSFSVRPEGYKKRVEQIFALLPTDPLAACDELSSLIGNVKDFSSI
jgi:hypothetical protein